MKKQTIYEITALEIRISSKTWDFMYESDPRDACVSFMVEQRYDILPLKNREGKYNQFMVTDEWNHFEKIKSKHKSILPKLKADSDFLTILKAFISSREKYFILHQGASIVGLISVANFSYREIYKRLYNLLAEMEIQLGNWVFGQIGQEEAIDLLIQKSNSTNNQSVLGQFLIDKRTGNDGHFREYLYLSSLHSLIKIKGISDKLGFSKKDWQEISSHFFKHEMRLLIL